MLEYSQHAGDAHRKAFGQFFTHPDVASFMTKWVLSSGKKSLFDPAFGLGAFRKAMPAGSDIEFSACEIDPKIIEFWKRKTGENPNFIIAKDYLNAWGGNHSNIVCNPPYMRFQKFANRNTVFRKFQHHLGVRLSGYTNTASAFLLKSLSELDATGKMAYIMPLEFLNTGYGVLIKERLVESGHLFAILRFDCEKNIFPDATTSVGVILYDKAACYAAVRFYVLESIEKLARFNEIRPISTVPLAQLNPEAKWLPLFRSRKIEADGAQTTALGYYGRFRRGIATGANEFFVLRPSAAQERGIGVGSECAPCITKSSQIKKAVFDDLDYKDLFDADRPVLLFSVGGKHSRQADNYIQLGESLGFNKRFLTRNRKPWYKTEKRNSSPLLLGVFSRGGYKVILNKSAALNLTCFHGFQPNLFGRRYIEHLFLYLSSRTGREIISLSMRKYGDSLDKFEPNDLNDALAPSPDFFAAMPTKQVSEAVKIMEEAEKLPQWAEDFFAPLKISAGTRRRLSVR